MITEQHIAESLSRACIQAIAGRAGFSLGREELDYGVDGSFNEVIQLSSGRRVASGLCLHFQLKASTRWHYANDMIVYDLEAKTFNDLVLRHHTRGVIPCVLVLLALPQDSDRWLECSESSVTIGGGCYWQYLAESETPNHRSVRISIPRQQHLTPQSLVNLFDQLKSGEWPP
jgi:hypothetical protein